MTVVANVDKKDMMQAMQREAEKQFSACNPDMCPQCRFSDG